MECSQRHLFGVLRCVLGDGQPAKVAALVFFFRWILVAPLKPTKNRGSNKFRNKMDMIRYEGTQKTSTHKRRFCFTKVGTPVDLDQPTTK